LNEIVLSRDDFEMDDFFRFERESDLGDEMIVGSIFSKNKEVKAIVVIAFGMYSDNVSSDFVKKLADLPNQNKSYIIDDIILYISK
jgi:hypothetical protein